MNIKYQKVNFIYFLPRTKSEFVQFIISETQKPISRKNDVEKYYAQKHMIHIGFYIYDLLLSFSYQEICKM